MLAPYLEGDRPTRENKAGQREWDMHCPLHEDDKRSASLNVDTGEWYCFAGCGGGRVTELIRRRSDWINPGTAPSNGRVFSGQVKKSQPEETITEAKISGWHSALLSNEVALDELVVLRGITTDTVIKYQIGWDPDRRVYSIPVRGPEGEIWNVRRYNMHPPPDRRKIWGVKGLNSARLFPIQVLNDDPEVIIICEGEWDALVTLQHGFPAITRTAAADIWQGEWNHLFKGRTVYLCHDMDDKGQTANRKVGRQLHSIADVRVVKLPYPMQEKSGKDLSDFWMEHDRSDFERMLQEAEPFKGASDQKQIETITVLDSFDARRVGSPVRMIVTIKGKKEPGYTVPAKVRLSCTRDAGQKCAICPLNAAGGEAMTDIDPNDASILAMLDASDTGVQEVVRKKYGALKCNRLVIEAEEHQAVEVLYARPSVDHSDGTQASDYKNIRVVNVGRHDTNSNNTVLLTGARHPNPRDQKNEFLAWDIEKLQTSVDKFEVTKQSVDLMRRFQVNSGQKPIKKLGEISRALSDHVTKIIGRPEMHAVMDLTFHSALSFKFGGQMVRKGWIDALIIGDTRTGKSEAATQLVRHYGVGEIIGGESATFAGVVGGMQQFGGKEWAVTWGVVPINDRRIVVIDELSGLSPEEIARMSDVRESGLAKLTMIQQEVTHARTRLLWLSNPRNARMSDYTYGVQALRPLIGNAEDIARFDVAMALSMYDVAAEDINKPRSEGELRYHGEACHALLMWVWTRQPDQIIWASGAEDQVYMLANDIGKRYVEDPPLIQAANIRIKIARLAVALAGRLFSTDKSYERIVVKPEHVIDAVTFLDHLYRMPSFGYAERSQEILSDREEAKGNKKMIKGYLAERQGLAKFLRNAGKFRRQDVEEILNVTREEANSIINKLWDARMVRKELGDIRIEPMLHELLREGTRK